MGALNNLLTGDARGKSKRRDTGHGVRDAGLGRFSDLNIKRECTHYSRGEDLHRIPGVEKNDAETGKVLHVARHEGEIVLKGRSGDHAIRGAKRTPREQPLAL